MRAIDLLAKGFLVSDFQIASAATSSEEIGNPVYLPAKKILSIHGMDCSKKRAVRATANDYEQYDYIVLMDRANFKNLRYNFTALQMKDEQKKISLLMDWTHRPGDVLDPWYTGDFNTAFFDIQEGCNGLLEAILAKNG